MTDARFSGVSTGACLGHVGPEALAGGPIGKIVDGDIIEIMNSFGTIWGRVDLVAAGGRDLAAVDAGRLLVARPRPRAAPARKLPDDTRLWAALQQASGDLGRLRLRRRSHRRGHAAGLGAKPLG